VHLQLTRLNKLPNFSLLSLGCTFTHCAPWLRLWHDSASRHRRMPQWPTLRLVNDASRARRKFAFTFHYIALLSFATITLRRLWDVSYITYAHIWAGRDTWLLWRHPCELESLIDVTDSDTRHRDVSHSCRHYTAAETRRIFGLSTVLLNWLQSTTLARRPSGSISWNDESRSYIRRALNAWTWCQQ